MARLVLTLAFTGLLAALLPTRGTMDGWSLFPPLAAIGVTLATGRLILGLSVAILSGAWLTLPSTTPWYWFPWAVTERALVDFIWTSLYDSFQLYILGFTAALIGMIRIIALAGGTQGIAQLLVSRAADARSTRTATILMGLAIFFDDYANTLVVGTTMRPITDRFKISREKLAYLVDSTAAPIAGIAVISTWIGYEVLLFDGIMRDLGTDISGYELFFRALPTRFYCLFTLAFVILSTLLRRDFGPMLRAERRAQQSGQVLAPNAKPMTGKRDDEIRPATGVQAHWATAAAPVALVISGVLIGMYWDASGTAGVLQTRSQYGFFSQDYWIAILREANAPKVMFIAALAGSSLAFLIALTRRDSTSDRLLLQPTHVLKTWIQGIPAIYYALLILVLAWAIKETCKATSTGDYLSALLSGRLDPTLLPLLVFLLSSLVAFSIGTSWTTMTILLPTMLPLAFELGGAPLGVLVASAVLDGAIFGDHCSPISDTTVLSSIAAGSDHIDHVKTQLPYAATTMTVAALCGYLGSTLLYSPIIGLLLGIVALVTILLLIGRNPDTA